MTSKPIHHSQKVVNENEGVISIDVRPNLELVALLLSFGSDIEILSPETFRNFISTKIEENFKIYFPVQNDCTDMM